MPATSSACRPSRRPSVAPAEAFGIVQAEAMACGKPVVNTWLRNGVNEVAVHDVSALTVELGDVAALAHALRRVLADTALARRLGVAGRDRVMRDFTVDAMVGKTLELYLKLDGPSDASRR